MFRKFHEKLKEHEEGFTLIELLVVILIIAILAAIAIPVFLRQREKGYVADVQSTLKNAATAAESAATTANPPGDYSDVADFSALVAAEGVKLASTQTATYVGTSTTSFCITVTDTRLAAGHVWRTGTYFSSDGAPSQDDTCT